MDEGPNEDSHDHANQLLENLVVPWITSLEHDAARQNVSLPEALVSALHTQIPHKEQPLAQYETVAIETLVQIFKEAVPWHPHVNFQTVPKSSKKGTIHISMLGFQPSGYTANGMFVADAQLLLATDGLTCLGSKV